MGVLSFSSSAQAIQAHAFAYQPSKEADAPNHVHPVVVVGAGPVGLSLAIDLAQRGQRVVLLDNDHRLSTGSRAICFAKRTLEVWDRLGVGDAMCAKGVGWSVGKVFLQDQELYRFDLLPEPGHERPAFINLQQYYAEAYLAVKAAQLPNLDVRWKHSVNAIEQDHEGVTLGVETPDGVHQLRAQYVAACDGSRSPLRALMGQNSQGRVFKDRFLIADVRMQADFPAERWFWFDPPFHRHQSVLLHRQPDDVWRIDFQLGWDADPEEEKKPERIKPRVQAMLQQAMGRVVPFELEWASVYTFACTRMPEFKMGRVLFAGDAAHGVSPFGARGANSGVQDADNLGWKLDAVLRNRAPSTLLDTYAQERQAAADENIAQSTRSTDFLTPKSPISRVFRDAALALSRHHPFARTLVNSGRLSTPTTYLQSTLNSPDATGAFGRMVPGAACADAPLKRHDGTSTWLLRELGLGFNLILDATSPAARNLLFDMTFKDAQSLHNLKVLWVRSDGTTSTQTPPEGTATSLIDSHGLLASRYGLMAQGHPHAAVLVRPDQHLCARWSDPTGATLLAALRKALGHRIAA
jgi:3-(3-hydroxy-phenyl)propionate hydroxylase